MYEFPAAGSSDGSRRRTTSTSSVLKPRKSHRVRSSGSVTSIQSRGTTFESETDHSEIYSPVPRRHHLLQAESTSQWLRTPSPLSTRESSPLTPANKTLSFSSLMEEQVRLSLHSNPSADDGSTSPARRWARWMTKAGLKPWILPSSILGVLWIKWVVGLSGYSGFNVPPMFGDYEAQRHWMEITLHLPLKQWYTYDLQYWGLDYPPLTAYVSWLCGWVAHILNPSWVALDSSRGIETPGSKVFMRATVLILDLLLYIPSVVLFVRQWHTHRSRRTQTVALLTILFQPALILIDSGHFQYNSVMLGFTIQSLNFFHSGHDLLGAVSFVLSLGFKQMALYYSPAVFAYLFGKCLFLGGQRGWRLFLSLAIVTSSTFVILFLPFLNPPSLVLHPLIRIFPFSRGLFEDKVANFWCASNVIIKWRSWLAAASLIRMATVFTLLGCIPSMASLIRASWLTGNQQRRFQDSKEQQELATPAAPMSTLPLLPYALLQASLTFFLFSFQVHEKSILLPLLPITLLAAGSQPGSSAWEWGILLNNVACFSMYPLLRKDGLGLQYAALVPLWNYLVGYNPLNLQPSLMKSFSLVVYGLILALHALELTIPPPLRLPDIYPVLNVLVSAGVFGLAWLWSLKGLVEVGWAISGLGNLKASDKGQLDH